MSDTSAEARVKMVDLAVERDNLKARLTRLRARAARLSDKAFDLDLAYSAAAQAYIDASEREDREG